MEYEFRFPLPLKHGLHARPATVLQVEASAFASDVRLVNERNGREANAKSVLSLVAADIHHGDACLLLVSGDEAARAFPVLRDFLLDVFPGCDEPLPEPEAGPGAVIIPRVLTRESATFYQGTPASPGIGEGAVFLTEGLSLPAAAEMPGAPQEEEACFARALAGTGAVIEKKLLDAHNATERAILEAHLAIVRDPEFSARVRHEIGEGGLSAGQAIVAAEQHFAGVLLAAESAYLRERAMDIRDVADQMLRALYGAERPAAEPPQGDYVCVAQNLAPSRFLALDRTRLKALVLSEGGTTSHTIILARAFGIPCVTGIDDIPRLVAPGQTVLVDARRGIVVPCPAAPVARYYALERRRDAARAAGLERYRTEEARTKDGHRLHVAANAATPEEAEAAFENGAEGIGLFRTEMLFLDRDAAPDEEEQFEAYSRVLRAAKGRPVIFRTLDIGGDKPASYLGLPQEDNPFLGYRAIRIYDEHAALIHTQMRALLRAAAVGPARVMFPMVSCVEEVRAVKARLDAAREELETAGTPHGIMELGIMVEVPSAAFAIDALSREVSFFSIGTNDLTQYFLAVDRGNAKVAGLYSPLHPSFLRLLKHIVDSAHAQDRWVGLCGEMGGSEAMAPLLIGLGLDEISLSGPAIPAMKGAIAACDSAACRTLLEETTARPDRAGVEESLQRFAAADRDQGILGADITDLNAEARTRDEVIKQMVDNLYLAGRVRNPDTVEEAVWRREEVYSTGVGFGIAIPHCKSPDVTVNSVAILRLREPADWNSLDDEPVRIALMLAIRESDEGDAHLRLFAKLARKIMHEEFRERLLTEKSVDVLLAYIEAALEN